ncbi:hypothetical protein ABW20_dc0109190 [Dactylellina cionopaga]|nr:hypothetical protein ABW20_dc0109190 [Dactylellina cionopaga]
MSICTVGTFYFWIDKPLDVEQPTVIEMRTPIRDILLKAGEQASKPFFDTRLDFVESQVYVSRSWHGWLRRFIIYAGLQRGALDRIPNDRDPQLHSFSLYFCSAILTAGFASIHMCGWNFPFPSHTEQLLWRVTSAGLMVVLGLYGFGEMFGAHLEGYTQSGLRTMRSYKKKFPQNLLFVIPGVFYFVIRILILWETLFCLRLLPYGAFIAIEWTDFLPHFG